MLMLLVVFSFRFLGRHATGEDVRPWQLAFRTDFAVSGLIDPEICELLMELMLTEGPLGRGSIRLKIT